MRNHGTTRERPLECFAIERQFDVIGGADEGLSELRRATSDKPGVRSFDV